MNKMKTDRVNEKKDGFESVIMQRFKDWKQGDEH